MPGDLTFVEPGEHLPVVVEADGSGTAPSYGDGVAITRETSRGTHVSLPGGAGDTLGTLERLPLQSDGEGRYIDPETATYDANEVIGDSNVYARRAVDWFPYDESGGWDQTATDPTTTAPTVNDLAVGSAGGVVQFNGQAAGPLGRVFRTIQGAEGTASKVAVLRYR